MITKGVFAIHEVIGKKCRLVESFDNREDATKIYNALHGVKIHSKTYTLTYWGDKVPDLVTVGEIEQLKESKNDKN